jgi:hypothetical protein
MKNKIFNIDLFKDLIFREDRGSEEIINKDFCNYCNILSFGDKILTCLYNAELSKEDLLNFNFKNETGDFDGSFDIDLSIVPSYEEPDTENTYTGVGEYKVYTYYAEDNSEIDIKIDFEITNVSGSDCASNISTKAKVYRWDDTDNEWDYWKTTSSKSTCHATMCC